MPPSITALRTCSAEHSLHAFVREAWPHLESTRTRFVDNWHIGFMCEVASAILPHRHLRHVIINIPPRSMKSVLFSVAWHAWLWIRHPELRFISVTYAQGLANRDSGKVRRLIASRWYQERWGDRFHILSKGAGAQDTKGMFLNDHTGFRFATAVGGQITGEGGHLVQVDDGMKAADALSEKKRASYRDIWKDTLSTRHNDQETGCTVVVGQRLHQQDPNGVIEEQIEEMQKVGVAPNWTKVVLPARYEGRPCIVDLRPYGGPLLQDPRTVPGEVLWKEKVSDEALKRLEANMSPFAIAGQLQQRPDLEAGGIYPESIWQYWDQELQSHHVLRLLASWDAAFKKGMNNSFTVGVAAAEVPAPNTELGARLLLLPRLHRERMNWKDMKPAVQAFDTGLRRDFQKPWVDKTLVEEKALGAAILDEFEGTIMNMEGINPGTDSKSARAEAASPYVANGSVLLPFGVPAFEKGGAWTEEFKNFPNGAHDDQVDAFSQLVLWWVQDRKKNHATGPMPRLKGAPTSESRPSFRKQGRV